MLEVELLIGYKITAISLVNGVCWQTGKLETHRKLCFMILFSLLKLSKKPIFLGFMFVNLQLTLNLFVLIYEVQGE